MRLTASDLHGYHRPSKCGLRIYLQEKGGVEEAEPSPYDQVIERLGKRHELSHLATFPTWVDLSSGALNERASRRRKEIDRGASVIYQGVLKADATIDGTRCEILGIPDFLISEDTRGYAIRDAKISRRITEKDHPEIFLQLGLYGWLYEQTLGSPPASLQVHSGTGEIVDVPYDGGKAALELLRGIAAPKRAPSEPYSPVGWSKCNGCGFRQHCWPRAQKRRDVALVPGVDQGLASALREEGVGTIRELLASFDEETLATFQRPHGKGMRRVGKAAGGILRSAHAMASGKEILIRPPEIPTCPNCVMFDLEGLPPQLDELEKIYLWGMQVFGEKPGQYTAATADFGDGGDRNGWEDFLDKAKGIFDEYGDLPFVHWHVYERTYLNKYIDRFGDRGGIAARVKDNLLDLHRVTQESIALPLPSYSLKVVEKYVGFRRSLAERSGVWAMAKYIEATEMEDQQERAGVMDEILKYNQEDLEATWAVFQWLKAKGNYR